MLRRGQLEPMRGKEVSFALQDRHVGLAATPEFNNFL